MAGLPEALKLKISEGKDLTADEVKLVSEYQAQLEKDVEFRKSEADKAFAARDEAKKKLREKEEADERKKEADLTEVEKANKKAEQAQKDLEQAKAKADEWDKYHTARVAELKEKLGDAWLDSYGSLPLSDLEKLVITLTNKKPGPGAAPGGGPDFPKSWQECLDDPEKLALVEKQPEIKAKLKREYSLKKG